MASPLVGNCGWEIQPPECKDLRRCGARQQGFPPRPVVETQNGPQAVHDNILLSNLVPLVALIGLGYAAGRWLDVQPQSLAMVVNFGGVSHRRRPSAAEDPA
jgi:hypothetical protein